MCMVSMIGEQWKNDFPIDWIYTNPPTSFELPVTREEFESLKNEVKALKELLIAAKKYDEATGQPDCEIDEKVDLIRRVAEAVGVDMGDVFGRAKSPLTEAK